EPLSVGTDSFSQGGWRLGRFAPAPSPDEGSAGTASGLPGGTLSRLDTFLGTRRLTLRAALPRGQILSSAGRPAQTFNDRLPAMFPAKRAPGAAPARAARGAAAT